MSCEGINRTFLEALASTLYRDADGNVHINTQILQANCEDVSPLITCENNFINPDNLLESAFTTDDCENTVLRLGISELDLPLIKSDAIETGSLLLTDTVWDDLRITPGSFDRPGSSDPAYVLYYPNGGGIGTYLTEWAKNNVASFVAQLPHSYKQGEDIYVHLHWTPGARGEAEINKTVGWKVDYTWANYNGTFSDMQTVDLSDVCDGVNHKHQMTDDILLTGIGADKNISSMLLCNIRRADTGLDDTWVGTISGQLPMLLEIDFHYPMDTLGSSTHSVK